MSDTHDVTISGFDLDRPERELDAARHERDEWKAKYVQQNKDLGCEMMDPNGTIWEHAAKIQQQRDRLERELVEANEYADKLAAGYPDGMLPKDIEVLREANYEFAQEIHGLREQRDVIMGRLSETHTRMTEAEKQRDRLAVICGELIAAVRINSMHDTFREATREQIEIWLKQWVDKLAAVKGGTL
jgi:hypothetical protein